MADPNYVSESRLYMKEKLQATTHREKEINIWPLNSGRVTGESINECFSILRREFNATSSKRIATIHYYKGRPFVLRITPKNRNQV